MSTSVPRPPHHPDRGSLGLRPELAAFFAHAARELAPKRVGAERGILAELRMSRGFD